LFESLQGIEELPYTRKIRWLWHGEDNLLWEIDEFSDKLSGLIIAEVELESEQQPVKIPAWAGMELTNMRSWSNASLARMVKDSEQN
jgi:adenylate cyclase